MTTVEHSFETLEQRSEPNMITQIPGCAAHLLRSARHEFADTMQSLVGERFCGWVALRVYGEEGPKEASPTFEGAQSQVPRFNRGLPLSDR